MAAPCAGDDLLTVVRDLSFCRTLAGVMDIVRVAARRLSGADGVTFVLRDGDQCHYAEENAVAPLWKGRRFPVRDCISGWVMLNRQAVTIPDVYADDRIPHSVYRPTFVRSLAMVPVRASDPLGAIGAYWAVEHAATAQETGQLQAVADAAALALENVKLYQGLQEALEGERNARRQAEEATRAKDEWISVLSHELRTPLTPILGWVSLLRSGAVDASRLHQALDVIERNARAETRIVDDLLDLSRLESGRLRIEMAPVDLVAVVAAAVDVIRPAASAKAIEIDVRGKGAGCEVVGNAERLQQAVWNLLSNAVKFTPPGGAVVVEVEREAGQAVIRVHDTGEGIGPDLLSRLFTRFERADTSSTRSSGGLGLGLTLVRKLVELHGGTVTAASPGLGCGATFDIRLPLQAAASAELGCAAPAAGLLSGLTVVVVDDDPDTLELLSFALQAHGAAVITAGSAQEGMQQLAACRPDVLVSDLAMPGEDGFTLMKHVRSVRALSSLPAVALSAYARREDARRALEAGYQLHLAKPIEPGTLAEHIRRLATASPGAQASSLPS